MLTLYPHISPVSETTVSAGPFSLHVEESGNPDGIPVLILHDGPGIGAGEYYRRLFDAERYRIIQFDQRGSGQSVPLAAVEENTTQELVDDIERVRQKLGVERWLILGFGWGAFLALNYVRSYQGCVRGVVLGSVFLARPGDIGWFSGAGIGRVFPDEWNRLLSLLPECDRARPVESYCERVFGENELERIQFAKQWATFIARVSTLHPSQSVVDYLSHPHIAISLARLQLFYWQQNCFMDTATNLIEALEGHDLSALPLTIVHGRYNLVYPLDGAMALQSIWPGSELLIIRDAGHSIHEPAIVDALVRACEQMGERLEPQTA